LVPSEVEQETKGLVDRLGARKDLGDVWIQERHVGSLSIGQIVLALDRFREVVFWLEVVFELRVYVIHTVSSPVRRPVSH
jgi:hypothetical protein